MDLGLKDKAALVTGGSRGIGRAAAKALLREGASVMVSSLRRESVEAAVKELAPLGRVEGTPCDVAVEADVVRLVAETVRRFGRLDVLVANAGIADPYRNLAETSVEDWDRMIAVHLRGTFLCGREAARAMRAAKIPGRIVTISSTSAYECDPLGGSYNAAKAGIVGLTRSMAIDFADWGIRVNSVAPGWIHSDMTIADLPPRGTPIENLGVLPRAGEPEEVAAAIVFLASTACDYMTGTTLFVDGGQTIVAPKMRW
ncbi:MAG TPA: SDR family oxidoreductase [Candidatus Polarisedimenticolia bacterium]|jgi:NAD(P)-dependent dehydrogenase (short-subunit alcohol dehydrogenase family)|nr:SDR family oxidoreductase [Candidatus Polarisedimenticolia bacterium]